MKPFMWLVMMIGLGLSSGVLAKPQTITVSEDQTVRFLVSTSGITRLSVVDDRIRKIVNDTRSTNFELQNDESTGDVFMRYIGAPDAKPAPETGYIVTEQGLTVAYSMAPSPKSPLSVVLKLKATHTQSKDQKPSGIATSVGGGGENGFVSDLVKTVRETLKHGVHSAQPKGPDQAVLHSQKVGDYVGTLSVAAAGAKGRALRERAFYKKGVLAVWVQKRNLGPGERAYVVTVRAR